jgi:hypothetical protein
METGESSSGASTSSVQAFPSMPVMYRLPVVFNRQGVECFVVQFNCLKKKSVHKNLITINICAHQLEKKKQQKKKQDNNKQTNKQKTNTL